MTSREDGPNFSEALDNLSFEEALKKLENLVENLEKAELPLEESIKYFQEAIKLSRRCRELLAEAEYRVEYLLKEEGLGEEELWKQEHQEPEAEAEGEESE